MIPAPPRGKQRARSTRGGRHYTPTQTVNAEAWIRLACTQQAGTPVTPGPVAVRVAFYLARPATMRMRDRPAAQRFELLPVTKPDLDNAGKLICDALNGIAWKDDAHVADLRALKFWAQDGMPACTVVEWWQMQPGEAAAEGRRMLEGPENERGGGWEAAEEPEAIL